MADDIQNKIKKEWVTEALGSLNVSPDKKIETQDVNEEAVILVSGTNMFGDIIYSYVKLTVKNFRRLSDAMRANDDFRPSDFGEVVAAGRGEPSAELKQEMAVTYGLVDVPKPKQQGITPVGLSQPKFFDED